MINLTKEQLEQIDVAREIALEKIGIFEKGVKLAYFINMTLRYDKRIMDWINLIREKLNKDPFESKMEKDGEFLILCFKDESELKAHVIEYLAEIERASVYEFGTGMPGISNILVEHGFAVMEILNLKL